MQDWSMILIEAHIKSLCLRSSLTMRVFWVICAAVWVENVVKNDIFVTEYVFTKPKIA